MLIKEVFDKFERYLIDRLGTDQALSEDSVRYSFFAALNDTKTVKQHEIILESPHPNISKAKIDTYINTGHHEAYLEFKFHRKSCGSSPKPQKAGSLFKDFTRLSKLESKSDKYVVYFTDSEMARYFQKQSEQYSGFWSIECGTFEFNRVFLTKTTNTFRKSCDGEADSMIEVIYSSTLSTSHEIRIFKVNTI